MKEGIEPQIYEVDSVHGGRSCNKSGGGVWEVVYVSIVFTYSFCFSLAARGRLGWGGVTVEPQV